MDSLQLPLASAPSKAKCATASPAPGQEIRLPRLSATRRRFPSDADDGRLLLGKQVPGRSEQSNNGLPHRAVRDLRGCNRQLLAPRKKAPKKPGTTSARRRTPAAEAFGRLSALDERVLILYHSSLKYSRSAEQQRSEASVLQSPALVHESYGPECTYAAIKIQKVARGRRTRLELAAFHGPRNQLAASTIQFAHRRALTRRRITRRLWEKRQRAAIRVQAWFRGCRGRDVVLALTALRLDSRIAQFQRRFRGLRFWRVVTAMLLKRKEDAAIEIQRVHRGCIGRRRATRLRLEKIQFAQDLQSNSELHARFARCEGCHVERCTEQSLLRCLMTRYLGLHDFAGAKTLGEQGIRQFPSSALLNLVYACLLQSTCEDLEVCMTYLSRANTEGIHQHELDQCEERYFRAALMLRPNDAALHLHTAVFFQSSDRNDRAEAHYEKALSEPPSEYPLSGYLERVRMVDRLLLNYHRFSSVFNFRQTTVLLKEMPIAKRGPKTRLRVAKMNHITIIETVDSQTSVRLNSVYLTDEELSLLLGNSVVSKTDGSSQHGPSESRGYLKLTEWRSNARASLRRANIQQVNRMRQTEAMRWRPVITQLYQDDFLGLNINPSDLSKYSLLRSRLRLTKDDADTLLKLLVFIDPAAKTSANTPQSDEQLMYTEAGRHLENLQRVMLIPRVLRLRCDRRIAFLRTHASIEIQRSFRGYRFRAEMRRERVMSEIHRAQVDEVLAKLSANYTRREMRRKSAAAIQRIVRGVQQRVCLRNWRLQAVQIQRVFRGYLGRKRAIAFREGRCTFYMTERVFQRGVEVSGHFLMLSIDKCGMSFRMDGYDAETCSSYHGLLLHQSAIGLLCYLNWTYAQSLCGRQLFLQGNRVEITSIASIDPATGECFMAVNHVPPDLQASPQITPSPSALPMAPPKQTCIPLVDCVNTINLRRMGTTGNDLSEAALPLPIKADDTRQLVDAIVERLVLMPALPMATHELRRRNAAGLILTVTPPPTMHYTFKRHQRARENQVETRSPRAALKEREVGKKHLQPAFFPPATVFPVVSSTQHPIIGKQVFRKKCSRHGAAYKQCRCVLPLVSTPAYIEAISLALEPIRGSTTYSRDHPANATQQELQR